MKALPTVCNILVVGAGPAGLAAATELKLRGVSDVVVVEREGQAGGIPGHCGHSLFGMREFKRVLSGPAYAAALTRRALESGVDIYLNTTVVRLLPEARLVLSSPFGISELSANKLSSRPVRAKHRKRRDWCRGSDRSALSQPARCSR